LEAPDGQATPFSHAVQLDVADCFDTIDHALLLEELARHVADPDLSRLLERIVQAGGRRPGALWWQRNCGPARGTSLSPLLCTLYPPSRDVAPYDLGQATQNGVRLLRYADDLLLLARDARLAERGLTLVRQGLRRLQQGLRDPGAAPRPVVEGV